jgi:hypothetical protein
LKDRGQLLNQKVSLRVQHDADGGGIHRKGPGGRERDAKAALSLVKDVNLIIANRHTSFLIVYSEYSPTKDNIHVHAWMACYIEMMLFSGYLW